MWSYLFFIAAVILIGTASDFYVLLGALFLVGATFPGRIIVGLNFLIEYFPARAKDTVTNVKMFSAGVFLLLINLAFQYGTRDYKIILAVLTTGCFLATLYMMLVIPESPAFLHERGQEGDYEKARKALTFVANFNGVYEVKQRPYERFRFVSEMKKVSNDPVENVQRSLFFSGASIDSEPDPQAIDDFQSIAENDHAEQDEEAAQNRFIINVVRMSIMWTAASFSTYLLLYLNKYLDGTVFVNYYLDAAATAAAPVLAAPIYSKFMTRISFLTAFGFITVGTTGVYLLEAR